MELKNFLTSLFLVFFTFSVNAEELKIKNQNTEFNVYTGMFDFSDDGKKSSLIGFQHQIGVKATPEQVPFEIRLCSATFCLRVVLSLSIEFSLCLISEQFRSVPDSLVSGFRGD